MKDDLKNLLAGMVKPLVWEFRSAGETWEAGKYSVGHNSHNSNYWWGSWDGKGGMANTLEAAQAAAQADYAARIASALNTDAVLALVAAAYADAADINSVCLAYRHDYGLMTPNQQESLRLEAEEWRRAWSKETTHATAALARMLALARAEGLGMAAEYCNGDEPGDFWPNLRAGIRAMKGEQL